MGRFTGDQVIGHPTIAVYTERPIINANVIASHLELGMQSSTLPPPCGSPWLVFRLLAVDISKYKYYVSFCTFAGWIKIASWECTWILRRKVMPSWAQIGGSEMSRAPNVLMLTTLTDSPTCTNENCPLPEIELHCMGAALQCKSKVRAFSLLLGKTPLSWREAGLAFNRGSLRLWDNLPPSPPFGITLIFILGPYLVNGHAPWPMVTPIQYME